MKTINDLLIPRWKVIADYPKSLYHVGDILNGGWRSEDCIYCDTNGPRWRHYPHLFRKLEWWEERTKEELMLVKHVKRIGKYHTGEIHTVASPEQDGRIWHVDNEIEFRFIKDSDLIPVTEEEYLTYINNKLGDSIPI